MIYYLPIVVAVLANLLYHTSQKLTPAAAHPLLTVGVSFATASALAFAGYAVSSDKSFAQGLRALNWTALGLGLAVVLIECSFLIAYRRGWPVGVASLVVTAGQTALLIPMGRIFFSERLALLSWVGAALCVLGLSLICLQPRAG